MNSVALPASASTPVLSAEADLVRQAARGDAGAFDELYRRHSAPAWRLAQAVTADRDAATAAFRDGFVRAVRSSRFTRRTGAAFRPHVLSSVYRAAIDRGYDRTAAPAPTRRTAAGGADAALADAAFRSLPERWRAALWLGDVENLETERLAAVLGVSSSVAEQLITRGRRGLAGRFAQAHRDAPEHIGEVLRPLTLSMPANLQDVTAARWSAAGADHMSALAPLGGWLEDRAMRPMSVAVGALIGLGLIGLGVVPGGSTVRTPVEAASNGLNGAVPVHTCYGLACPSGTVGGGPYGPLGATSGTQLTSLGAFPSSGSTGSGVAGGTSGLLTGLTGGTGTTVGTGTVSTPGGGTTTPPSGGGGGITLPGGGVTLPGGGGGGGGSTVGVNGVATLSTGSSGSTLNLLGGTATATVGSGGLTTTLGGTTILSTATTSTTAAPTTTTTTPLQSVTSTVTNTVTGTTNTVTGLVGTLSSGL